jgi:hypothetical protein
VTLFRCCEKPLRGLSGVLANSFACSVGERKIELGFGVPLLGCLSVPPDSFDEILLYAPTIKQTHTKIPLPFGISA